jgi:hypothetical protein
MEEENVLRIQAAELHAVWLPVLFMTIRREMADWRAISARSEPRETCEPGTCQSRISRQSHPSRLHHASAIAAEAFTNKVG